MVKRNELGNVAHRVFIAAALALPRVHWHANAARNELPHIRLGFGVKNSAGGRERPRRIGQAHATLLQAIGRRQRGQVALTLFALTDIARGANTDAVDIG